MSSSGSPVPPDHDRIAALEHQVALLTARLEATVPAPAPAPAPALARRDLLLRGGAVLAGAAGAATLGARPAAAAPGDAVLQGRANDAGGASTSLRGGSGTLPTLLVENPTTRDVADGFYAGPALRLPGTVRAGADALPNLGLDERDSVPGDLTSGGDFLWYAHVRDEERTITGAVYSSAFANHLEFVAPRRLLDTRRAAAGEEAGAPNDGRSRVVAGRFDAAGRLQAGSALVLDLSRLLDADAAGVLGNLTVVGPQGSGFLAAYPTPEGPPTTTGAGRPAVSSLNFVRGAPATSNFAVVGLPVDGRITVYTSTTAHVLFDVAAFSVYEPFSTSEEAGARRSAGWRGRR